MTAETPYEDTPSQARADDLRKAPVERKMDFRELTGDSELEHHRAMRDIRRESAETLGSIEKERLAKLKQQGDQRRHFFVWAIVSISGVLVASTVFMSGYLITMGDQVEPSVMIAWFSSALVETLGLGYIIANSLYEASGKSQSTKL